MRLAKGFEKNFADLKAPGTTNKVPYCRNEYRALLN